MAIEGKVYINGFSDLKSISSFAINTAYPQVLALCNSSPMVAFPSEKKGYLQIYNIDANKIIADFKVAESNVAYLSFSDDGSMVATASEKGTLVRVYDLKNDGKLKKEVRRGSDRAEIYCLSFFNNDILSCASDKGTVHIFIVGDGEVAKQTLNSLGPSFKGLRSFAKFRLTGIYPKCYITSDKKLIVITKEGFYYIAEIDWNKGGECAKLDKQLLMDEEKGEKAGDK